MKRKKSIADKAFVILKDVYKRQCNMILREFGLFSPLSHIINGHTPVKTVEGEEPVRANGKLIVICLLYTSGGLLPDV